MADPKTDDLLAVQLLQQTLQQQNTLFAQMAGHFADVNATVIQTLTSSGTAHSQISANLTNDVTKTVVNQPKTQSGGVDQSTEG
jgi:uncharacterized protein YhbP (UPF0306 family)